MSSAEHERLLRRARAQDAALFRYRLIGPALEEGLMNRPGFCGGSQSTGEWDDGSSTEVSGRAA